jgi:cysteinyl-tRNA synthetase
MASYLKTSNIGEPWVFFDELAVHLADDLHIVWVMTRISEVMSTLDDQIIWSILDFDDLILKLWFRKSIEQFLEQSKVKAPPKILELAEARLQAKLDKDYALADDLRKQITMWGWRVKDVPWSFDLEKL